VAITLRLTPKQEKLLKEVMDDVGEVTSTKTILNLITRFKGDQELIENLTTTLGRVDYQFKDLKREMRNRNETEIRIQKILSGDIDEDDDDY
jgi:tRNA isopentenyl-2-thiomethyl-A-37 hydroxylase MiaE